MTKGANSLGHVSNIPKVGKKNINVVYSKKINYKTVTLITFTHQQLLEHNIDKFIVNHFRHIKNDEMSR